MYVRGEGGVGCMCKVRGRCACEVKGVKGVRGCVCGCAMNVFGWRKTFICKYIYLHIHILRLRCVRVQCTYIYLS